MLPSIQRRNSQRCMTIMHRRHNDQIQLLIRKELFLTTEDFGIRVVVPSGGRLFPVGCWGGIALEEGMEFEVRDV